ncbi:MAG: VOC family protein [Acidimicrobiia bacterium]|nr:VOC family protein [Acidimicrobiia bacterium]
MTSIEPHIWVDDLPKSIDWYRGALGFEVAEWYPDDQQPTWVQMTRGDAAFMLASEPQPNGYLAAVKERMQGPGPAISLYLHVEDADAVHADSSGFGAEIIEPIWDAWWGGRQFTVADPDGNWWTVFQSTGD